MMEQLKANLKKAGLVSNFGQVHGAGKVEESCNMCASCWIDQYGCAACTNGIFGC